MAITTQDSDERHQPSCAHAPFDADAAAAGATTGAIGWMRANLFSSPLNIALTILSVAADRLDRAAARRFLFIDAVWSGADREACLPTAERPGSRRLLGLRARPLLLFHLRLLSDRRSAGGSTCSSRCSRSASSGCCGSTRRAATSARSISSSSCRSSRSSCCSAVPLIGLRDGRHLAVGRRAGHHRGVVRSASCSRCRSASCWRSGAARTCRRCRLFSVIFIEFVRGVPLITVLFMASVMLPLFVPRRLVAGQAAARADRRRAVRLRLHGGGGARRPAGDPEGPVRRRDGARASATGR